MSSSSGFALSIDTCLPLVVPGVDFPYPTTDWTQTDWDEHFCGLVIKSLYSFLQLIGVKFTERRNITCPTKIVIVKTQCAKISKREVVEFLADPYVLSGLKTVPSLYSKRCDPEWWLNLFSSYRDKLLFICKFSMRPDPCRDYPFVSIGSSKWRHPWYIVKMSPLNGCNGIGNPSVNGWDQWGNLSLLKIKPEYIKSVLRNYALQFKSAKTFVRSVLFFRVKNCLKLVSMSNWYFLI